MGRSLPAAEKTILILGPIIQNITLRNDEVRAVVMKLFTKKHVVAYLGVRISPNAWEIDEMAAPPLQLPPLPGASFAPSNRRNGRRPRAADGTSRSAVFHMPRARRTPPAARRTRPTGARCVRSSSLPPARFEQWRGDGGRCSAETF